MDNDETITSQEQLAAVMAQSSEIGSSVRLLRSPKNVLRAPCPSLAAAVGTAPESTAAENAEQAAPVSLFTVAAEGSDAAVDGTRGR